jgi:acylphosphatase
MPDADRVRVRVVVRGRVQGVFFRALCADEARGLGLAGFVRNRPDGALEAEFEGPSEAVEAIVAWCRVGPPHARVDEVRVQTRPPGGAQEFVVTG